MAAAAPARRRTAKLTNTNRRVNILEDLDIILVDLDGLDYRHVMRVTKRRAALEASPDFAGRILRRNQVTAARETHELMLYMIHGDDIVCSMSFFPRAVPGGHVGYVGGVDCFTAYARVKPRSYVLFYTMAQIVRKIGVKYMYLLPVSMEERYYYKLFQFYHTLGFRCIERGVEPPSEELDLARVDAFYNAARGKRFLTSEKGKQQKANSMEYYSKCYNMIGRVSDIIEVTRDVFH
jgi:hypothetical protein